MQELKEVINHHQKYPLLPCPLKKVASTLVVIPVGPMVAIPTDGSLDNSMPLANILKLSLY